MSNIIHIKRKKKKAKLLTMVIIYDILRYNKYKKLLLSYF